MLYLYLYISGSIKYKGSDHFCNQREFHITLISMPFIGSYLNSMYSILKSGGC